MMVLITAGAGQPENSSIRGSSSRWCSCHGFAESTENDWKSAPTAQRLHDHRLQTLSDHGFRNFLREANSAVRY